MSSVSGTRTLYDHPSGIAIARDGTVYVTDTVRHRVQAIAPDGTVRATWGREGDGPGEFRYPRGIAVARDGTVVVADFGKNREIGRAHV